MAEKVSYYELFKHPQWQRKRLEILERAGFECEDCGAKENTLHVHHSYCERGRKPWEHPSQNLHWLREDRHKKAQDRKHLLDRQLGHIALSDMDTLLGFPMGLEAQITVLDVFSYEVAMGIGRCWALGADEVSKRPGRMEH